MAVIEDQRATATLLGREAPGLRRGGMGQASGLVAELLLMRMVSGSPISPASMSALARMTGG